ncbi:MAG TPA: DUF3086 domain-containing protein [Cyanobacteria bacterium UBA11162]|nr:DUF3086 domain-containing protein [Cyanobacteria bacterium UBA11162]
MNSDQSQTQEQEQEQQLAVENFDQKQLQPEPEAEVSNDLNEPVTEVELSQPEAQELPNLEELTVEVEAVQALEVPEMSEELTQTVADLQRQEQELREKIAALEAIQSQLLSEQLTKTQTTLEQMVQEGLSELEQRKQALLISIEQLERRRERIRTEMRTTFAGVSQDLAIRVQGFKDYLVGSLQDLAAAAEQLELSPPTEPQKPTPTRQEESQTRETSLTPKFAEQGFQEQVRQIRSILDQYRKMPDYYGPPWQLRRTFEPIHAERVSNWFFTQGGRGALRTMGSRLQNILVASAVMSVLRTLYGDRLRTLVLANTPERLGEWRRGLQDCLGISRSDFGPERGVVLFEEAPALVQKADRLVAQKQLPLILIDETEDKISLSLLQFPLWLAFAPDPQQMSSYEY